MDVAPIVEVKKEEKKEAVAALPSRPVKRKTQEELALLAQYVQTTPGVLNLNGKNINDSEIKLFLPYFKANPNIVELHLADNLIGPEGAIALAGALAHLNNFQRLNLDGNRIGDAGARAISALINAGNSQLRSLELFKNGIGNEGADALASAFTFSSTLNHLDLQQNTIGEPGAGAIADALKANQSVQVLRLNKNKIDMEGIEKIANGIKENSTLLYIDVSFNPLGRFGCKYVCECLKGHPTLKEVHLAGVGLTDEHMETLQDSIMFNSVLLVLNLSMNEIGNRGVACLMDGLRINSIVQEIEMWGNKMDNAKKEALYLKCKDRNAA